ncbi:MAG: hypothetical protein M3163_09800, partial [Actinomycetota bacterium]|nr:hypothetical protein [Actinomycetota bacterium]
MKRTLIPRGLLMVVAALVVAVAGISVTPQSTSEPTLVEVTAPDVPSEATTTTTTAAPTTTSTTVKAPTTSSTSTTVAAPAE